MLDGIYIYLGHGNFFNYIFVMHSIYIFFALYLQICDAWHLNTAFIDAIYGIFIYVVHLIHIYTGHVIYLYDGNSIDM